MKKVLFLLLFAVAGFFACKQDQSKSVDLSVLQKNMDADPEVGRLRTVMHSMSRMLAAIPPAELDKIFSKTHDCGIQNASHAIKEMETCLAGLPYAENYIEYLKLEVQYKAQYEVVEKRFSEFAQLDIKKQSEILIPVDEEEAEKVLSDIKSNKNK